MAEPSWHPTARELDEALVDLSAHIAYPPTEQVAEAVCRRVRATRMVAAHTSGAVERGRTRATGFPPPLSRLRRRLAVLLLALGIAVVGLLAVAPGTRLALAQWLGLRGVVIVYRPAPPVPRFPSAGTGLPLGQRILLPTLPDVNAPDAIYMGELASGGRVTLVYRARPGLPRAATIGVGLLLIEIPDGLPRGAVILGKGLDAGTRLETVTVAGAPGYWLSGRPHRLFYTDAQGNGHALRLAGNVLLWQRGGVTLRLEAALSKGAALRIAASVR